MKVSNCSFYQDCVITKKQILSDDIEQQWLETYCFGDDYIVCPIRRGILVRLLKAHKDSNSDK